jgi:hypothetical protein
MKNECFQQTKEGVDKVSLNRLRIEYLIKSFEGICIKSYKKKGQSKIEQPHYVLMDIGFL